MSVLDRIRQAGGDFYRRVANGSGAALIRPAAAYDLSGYEQRQMILANRIYDTVANGGARKYVLKSLGRPCADESKSPIIGYFNPCHGICDFSTNAFGGSLGNEMNVLAPDGSPLSKAVKDAIYRIWRWSNLDTRSAELAVENANQGAVGCRIVYEPGPPGRVFLDLDQRSLIKNVVFDARRNVETVWLECSIAETNEDGTPGDTIKVEEIISKFGFSIRHDGEEQLTLEQQLNPLGICPYVIFNYEMKVGQDLGVHAYEGSENLIHGINWTLSNVDESTRAHLWPYLFSSSPAKAPTKLTLGRTTMLHSQTRENMPQPTFETLVPKLNYQDIVAYVVQNADWLRERQPQMVLNSLKLIGGVSGETLQQLLIPAQAESKRVRRMIETAMVSAIQIALSVGVYHRLFELGTGAGTKESADRAFGDGAGPEAFKFAERPALPPTVAQQTQQASADQAPKAAKYAVAKAGQGIGLPTDVTWADAGYSPAQITAMKKKRAKQDTLETDDEDELTDA